MHNANVILIFCFYSDVFSQMLVRLVSGNVIRARAPKVRGPIEIGPFLLIIIIQAL